MELKEDTMKTEESATCTVYPIVTALDKADDMLGEGRIWVPRNDTQEIFVPIFNLTRTEAKLIKDIKSIASRSADEINKFLADEGFSIKLDPFKEPTDFGTASVLDVLVNWLVEGKIEEIRSGRDRKTNFPGVFLISGVYFARSPAHAEPIVVIETKSGDRVCMTVHDRCEGFKLLNRAKCLQETMTPNSDFRGVLFPQVSLDQKVDISWLQRLRTVAADGRAYEVAQALQQTKFRMNEKGARAQSAVAIGIKTTSVHAPPPPPLIIDQPFLVWIFRKGLQYPLFTGWISEEDWNIPRDISEK